MSSVTTAEATTLYHNSGNPEEELSQMLLLFIVGIGAASLSVCIAKSTKCCMERRKRKRKKKRELLDVIEAAENIREDNLKKSIKRELIVKNEVARWPENEDETSSAHYQSTSIDEYLTEGSERWSGNNTPAPAPYETTPVVEINDSNDESHVAPNSEATEHYSSITISRGEDIPYGLIADMITMSHTQWRKKETQRILLDSMISKMRNTDTVKKGTES